MGMDLTRGWIDVILVGMDKTDNRIIHGDCVGVMGSFAPASFDAIVVDPPYGLEFMGKEWDAPHKMIGIATWGGREHGAVAIGNSHPQGYIKNDPYKSYLWHSQWLTEAYRVLKPGASLLAMGGTRTFHRLACALEDTGFIIKDCLMWIYGSGFPKAQDLGKMIDKRGGNDKEWDGWKVGGIKPAYEPIIWAVKPPEGSYVDNVLKYGVGAVNVEECRVEFHNNRDEYHRENQTQHHGIWNHCDKGTERHSKPQGRFPANVILDEEAGRMLDKMSGELHSSGGDKNPKGGEKSTFRASVWQDGTHYQGDSGGASRFFYCAKASKSERGEGNVHPTVKPVKLFEWLIKLVTREGQVVLDPFFGSGTTGIACNNVGRRWIGIEKDGEYVKIAEKRLSQLVIDT